MKLAIIGSRGIEQFDIDTYIPAGITEIVSGGAKGVDRIAREYALKNGIKLSEFIPDYKHYGRVAPLKRNEEIANYADEVLAFWDGKSRGTEFTVNFFKKLGKNSRVVIIQAIK